ncbi:unnamed protein product [Symbiodinium sp. CCMP2592]|nr:unnamed protein product [Symbiodinium sp. CCMP2592]
MGHEPSFVSVILEGARHHNDDIRECAVCALKGLIQHPEDKCARGLRVVVLQLRAATSALFAPAPATAGAWCGISPPILGAGHGG